MNKEQIEEMAVIGCVRNPQAHSAEECAKCDFKNGQCNSYRHAEALYNAGYRKTFTSDLASDTQKAFKEGYIKGSIDRMSECNNLKDEVCKETAKEILDMLYDMGIDKGILECCRIYDVNGVSLAKQICEKYGVEIEK